MRVKIIRKNFGGVEFGPEMRVLHLGGQSSANVERLEFELPQEWAGCAVTLHIQRQDGTLPTPILLDEEHSAAVGKEFTASPCGSWMLLALGEDGYRALTRPARYDCYETLNTDGDAEISPTQYELFVARVLGYATGAQESAKEARNAAAAAKRDADTAATAGANAVRAAKMAQKAAGSAQSDAERAQRAADRAENFAPPEDGAVVSVNGMGGTVVLGAEDVGAVPQKSAGYLKKAAARGRTLVLTRGDDSTETLQLQDSNGVLGSFVLELQPEGWVDSGRGDHPLKNEAALEMSRELFLPSGMVLPESGDAAEAAQMAYFCETRDGSVVFYAKEKPTESIKVQTVIYGTAADISTLDLATDEEFEAMMKELDES